MARPTDTQEAMPASWQHAMHHRESAARHQSIAAPAEAEIDREHLLAHGLRQGAPQDKASAARFLPPARKASS